MGTLRHLPRRAVRPFCVASIERGSDFGTEILGPVIHFLFAPHQHGVDEFGAAVPFMRSCSAGQTLHRKFRDEAYGDETPDRLRRSGVMKERKVVMPAYGLSECFTQPPRAGHHRADFRVFQTVAFKLDFRKKFCTR